MRKTKRVSQKGFLNTERVTARLLGLPVFLLGAFSLHLDAADYTKGAEDLLKFMTHTSSQQYDQLTSMNQRADECIDAGQRRSIEQYLEGTRRDYLLGPFNSALQGKVEAVDNFVEGVEDLVGSRRGMNSRDQRRLDQLVDQGADSSNAEFQRLSEMEESAIVQECLQRELNVSRLEAAKDDFRSSVNKLRDNMALNYRFNNASSVRSELWNSADKSSTQNALAKFNLKIASEVRKCCSTGDSCSSILSKAEALDRDLAAAFDNNSYKYRSPPNPLTVEDLTCSEIEEIIRKKSGTLKQLRAEYGKERSEDEEYYDEQDVFASMAQCRIKAKRYQDRGLPIEKRMWGKVGQLLKCTVAPMWGSGKKTSTQQLTSAVSGMDIPGVECDPGTQQMWDTINAQGRDLNNWGIQGLENADHLVALRSIPPIDTGLALPGLTADEYLLMTPSPGIDGIANLQGAAGRTTANPVNAGVGPQLRSTISSDGGSSGSAGSSAGRSPAAVASISSSSNASSGVSRNTISSGSGYSLIKRASAGVNAATQAAVGRGQTLVQGVRAASSNIRKGVDARISSLKLKESSQKLASTLSTGVSRSMISTPSSRRSSRSQTANDVRRTTLRTLGASASRAVGEGILDSLKNVGNSVDDIGQQRREVESAVKSQIQKHLNNIEMARVKGEEARQEIMAITNEHALAVAEAKIEADGQPTAVIAEIMKKLHHKIADISTRAGVKRAAYDTAQAAIYAEQSAMQRLLTFGPQNLNLTIPGGDRGRGSSSTNSAGDTYQSISNTGAMPNGLPADGRGRVSWLEQQDESALAQLWNLLNPIQEAWASTFSEQDAFFMKEWRRFLAGMQSYVEDREKARTLFREEAAEHLVRNKTRNSPENFSHINSNALLSMDMYLSELESEVEYILSEAERKRVSLSVPVKNNIVTAAANAREARKAWNQAQRVNFEDLPENPEEHPEVWLSFLPEIILN